MEVDNKRFWPQLLPILKHISNAAFIAFDLEMSGIALRGLNDRSHDAGKPTLQQQYEETKEAAEKYQILQLGITCVEQDHELGMYVARPYNFNVSPLFIDDDRLGINRDITLSSSAVHFLMKNNFDMGAVFLGGVPYLSRKEEVDARKIYAAKENRSATMSDIFIAANDQEALKFYRNAKETVSSWINQKKQQQDFVNVRSHGGLNGYQRRLVHQLIRNDFPGYRVFARNGGEFMQVEKLDPQREKLLTQSKFKQFEVGIAKQTGLRYMIEALAGGENLDNIDPRWFCTTETGDPRFIDVEAVKKEIYDLQKTLQSKPPVIVGHNLFTDLVFIYHTFISDLPDDVEDFKLCIHNVFPHVFDTKYLATHEGGSMQTNSNLKGMYEGLRYQTWPFISLAEDHNSYLGKSKEHEAGYDSYMTAQVFVKLSTKLKAEQETQNSMQNDNDATAYETADESLDIYDGENEIVLNPPNTDITSRPKLQNVTNGQHTTYTKNSLNLPMTPKSSSRFASGTRFDQLFIEGVHSDSDSESDGGVALPNSPAKMRTNLIDLAIVDLPLQNPLSPLLSPPKRRAGPERHAAQLNPKKSAAKVEEYVQWMPSFKSAFWTRYMNKLRVYGTDSEICELKT